MTEAHCFTGFAYCAETPYAKADIRGGKWPPALTHLLPEERDRQGFQRAITKANEEYIRIGPQWATDEDRQRVLAIFAEEIQKYIEETYGKSS